LLRILLVRLVVGTGGGWVCFGAPLARNSLYPARQKILETKTKKSKPKRGAKTKKSTHHPSHT
jgi:hypothetical protein